MAGYKLLMLRALENPIINLSSLVVYVREDVSLMRLNNLQNDEDSIIWIEIHSENKKTYDVVTSITNSSNLQGY